MSASAILRTARSARSLSQRALADASHVSQPRIADIESGAHDTSVSRLEELLAALNHQVALIPTRTRPVWRAAVDVRVALAEDGRFDPAFREVIQLSDDLRREGPAIRVALAVTRPTPIGDLRYDALLAGIVDYWLTVDALPRPDWLDDPAYVLDLPWDVEPHPQLRDNARRRTPPAIARHGVHLAKSELESV
jgi:transcriptional regulator with XRE-family HTH domain